ncbi:MAG: type II toxin-antitoxin system RelB/DinJ family antitoxin [Chloroflexi bacterium]|nr:MAG: type II toxin-antitoxin system RelB/DinJ family antitoxin [Chloroflexota bacterium]
MSKSAVISTRIEPGLKESVEQVFARLGLTTTQAITLFFRQVELQQGLPFTIKLPNANTVAALQQAQARQNLTTYADANELFTDLGI